MTRIRSTHALTLRPFGRRPLQTLAAPLPQATMSDELRLFALTFAGGFLFMSIFLA